MKFTVDVTDASLLSAITAMREARNQRRRKLNAIAERQKKPLLPLIQTDADFVQLVMVELATQGARKFETDTVAIDAKIAALQERKDKLTKAKPVEAAAER